MEKKKMVVAATNALLQAKLDVFVPDEAHVSLFRVDGASVTIPDSPGMEPFLERAVYYFEHGRQPFPIPRKKLPPVLSTFAEILKAQYKRCMNQIEAGAVLDINAYAKDSSTIEPGTIDIGAFIKSVSSALWDALL